MPKNVRACTVEIDGQITILKAVNNNTTVSSCPRD